MVFVAGQGVFLIMISIERSAILPTTATKMFDLINDVASYPKYMSGCERVEVLEQSATSMVARLHVRKAGLSQSFTTRNVLSPPKTIQLNLVEGPFSKFSGLWEITELGGEACKVVLSLEFVVKSKLAAKALERLFKSVADDLVEAVSQRALQQPALK